MLENEAKFSVRESEVFAGTELKGFRSLKEVAATEEHVFALRAERNEGIGIFAQPLMTGMDQLRRHIGSTVALRMT